MPVGLRYNKRRILNIALRYEPHPDNITPAVMGGFNVACIEGDKIYSKKRRLPSYLKAVLVVPNKTISTAKSRTILPGNYSKEELIFSLFKEPSLYGRVYLLEVEIPLGNQV